MMVGEEVQTILEIDKSSWTKVKLGDVVREARETVKDPAAGGIDRIVGLEHLEPESLHIKTWGALTDGTTFTKVFRKGQVLFGRRRAYLKKAALATFDGICSGDITVLEAKKGLLPELLPFLIQNDKFFDLAVKNSAGSLSPRAKFNDFADYEFLLPPKDQQEQITQLLWAGDKLIEQELNILKRSEILLGVASSELIWNKNYNVEPLVKFASSKLNKLVDGDWIESKDQSESGIRLLQLADIGVRDFINKSNRFINQDTFERLRCFEVLPDDVLIARMPDPIGRACIVEDIGERMITAVDCCIARVDSAHSYNRFLLHLLNTREFLNIANSLASGTTRQRISRKNLEAVKVPKPNLETQIEVANKLDTIYAVVNEVSDKIFNSKSIQKAIINKIF